MRENIQYLHSETSHSSLQMVIGGFISIFLCYSSTDPIDYQPICPRLVPVSHDLRQMLEMAFLYKGHVNNII
jgi:hypothetical protein